MQLDAIRFVIGIAILSIASYTDIKRREADDKLWLAMGSIGIFLLFFSNYDLGRTAISIAFSLPFAFLLYLFEFGGADVKAMWAITLLSPLPPKFYRFPLFSSPIFIFPLTVLLNSLLLFLPLPIIFFLYNLYKKNTEFPLCFFGYKMKASEAKNKFVWSMEANGKKKIMPVRNFDFDKAGDKEIWVTPKFPFLVFILIGFAISFIIGDLLFVFLSLFF